MGWYRGKLPLAPKERSLGERFFLFGDDARGGKDSGRGGPDCQRPLVGMVKL